MNPDLRRTNSKKRARLSVAFAMTLLIGLLAFLAISKRQSATAHSQPQNALVLSSSSFVSGQAIPRRFTCDGENVSPELHWIHVPAGTKSFALVMHDPDAPVDFTHWLVNNIPPSARDLAEGASTAGAMPAGSQEGVNGFGRSGYGGPVRLQARRTAMFFNCLHSIAASIYLPERREHAWNLPCEGT